MHIKRAYDPHRDLLELRGLERPACSNTLVPRGSHHISSLWSPVVATGGNRRQIAGRLYARKQAKSVAVGCHRLPEAYGKECHEEKGLPDDRLRLVVWSYRRGGPLRCCTPDWISVASVSISTCSTQRVRPSTSARHRLTQKD